MNKTLRIWFMLLVASVSAFATTHNISTADALRNLNACEPSDTVVLKNSIQLAGPTFIPLCPDGFRGVFDGNGDTIMNMNISASLKTYNNMAFIAILGEGGVLKNVTFKDAVISAYQEGNGGVHGASVAVAVGKLEGGSVENVHVVGGSISASIGTQSSGDAGGLAGTAESGSISESDGDISVSGSNSAHIGGICGSVTGDVTLTSVSYTGNAPAIAGDGMETVTIATKYGAVTINEKNSVKSAVIDGDYTAADTAKSPSDIAVSSVTLSRSFNGKQVSTLMLPFDIDADKVIGTPVYKYKTIVRGDDGRWKFKITAASKIYANTPYVVLPPESGPISFNVSAENPVIFNTTKKSDESTSSETSEGTWEFKGVYTYTVLDEDFPEIDRIYVFANEPQNEIRAGQFVKADPGTKIKPMRAYLVRHNVAAKSARGSFGGSFLLPNEIDIEIEDEKGFVVEKGRLNTVTGEVRMDRWFDLKGRKLNSRPFVKGSYYKNGKKVIIK